MPDWNPNEVNPELPGVGDGGGNPYGGTSGPSGNSGSSPELSPAIVVSDFFQRDNLSPPLPEEEPVITQQARSQERRRRGYSDKVKSKAPRTSGIRL